MVYVSAIDETMVGQLWRLHSADLVRYASLLVGSADAPDIVSSAFMKASKRLGSDLALPRAYLFRAVTNEAHSLRRGRSRRWQRELRAIANDSTGIPESQIDVRRAIADLSVQQRAVIFFIYWEDLTEVQTAQHMSVSLGTVRRHLSRAREHLRKALQ